MGSENRESVTLEGLCLNFRFAGLDFPVYFRVFFNSRKLGESSVESKYLVFNFYNMNTYEAKKYSIVFYDKQSQSESENGTYSKVFKYYLGIYFLLRNLSSQLALAVWHLKYDKEKIKLFKKMILETLDVKCMCASVTVKASR
ncbi:unnamed protein product [Onchocerca flexuosa]|uniref:Uncharacterized protein n=1 Tax=Onchocerca flexuosa TaxID=387005 RepID=A0A183HB28_9BILA|nr:unnamed protein product [Onchocerca flexuosa]